MISVNIDSEYIKLDQLLKLSGVAQTGGHAKMMIIDGEVELNGQVVTQRGKKIRKGDIVSAMGEDIEIV